MTKQDFDEQWDEAFQVQLHDDGTGMYVYVAMTFDNGKEVAVSMSVKGEELGLPPINTEELKELAARALVDLGHAAWPEEIPSLEEMVDGDATS